MPGRMLRITPRRFGLRFTRTRWPDFKRLHSKGLPHCGIVVCTYDPETESLAPCLGCLDVTPWQARLEFSDCHYITVSSPSGGVGGFNSVSFRAFRTRRVRAASADPRRSGRSSMRNVTKRTVCAAPPSPAPSRSRSPPPRAGDPGAAAQRVPGRFLLSRIPPLQPPHPLSPLTLTLLPLLPFSSPPPSPTPSPPPPPPRIATHRLLVGAASSESTMITRMPAIPDGTS